MLVMFVDKIRIANPQVKLHYRSLILGLAQNGNTLYNENKNAVEIGVLARESAK